MKVAYPLEDVGFALTCVLAVVLPILEAPKSIMLGLLMVVTLTEAFQREQWRLRIPDPLESILLAMLLVSIVSTALNWSEMGHAKGVKDVFFVVSTCWLVYRQAFSARRRYLVAVAIATGILIGLAWAIVDVLRGARGLLEFNSAGIATQSSIYLGVAIVMAFGVAYTGIGDRQSKPSLRVSEVAAWWGVALIMLLGLFAMASRGAILAILIVFALVVVLSRNPRLWVGMLAAMLLAMAVALALPGKFNSARFMDKTEQLVQTGKIDKANDGVRFDMWRIGLAQFTQGGSPFFGIGPRNFPSIDLSGLQFSTPLVAAYPRLHHAHNLFLTKLVEEGVGGLTSLLALFGLVTLALVRDWSAKRWLCWEWFAALGALVVPVVAGFFNTPWGQEHAMLAMMIFGLYFNARKSCLMIQTARPNDCRSIGDH